MVGIGDICDSDRMTGGVCQRLRILDAGENPHSLGIGSPQPQYHLRSLATPSPQGNPPGGAWQVYRANGRRWHFWGLARTVPPRGPNLSCRRTGALPVLQPASKSYQRELTPSPPGRLGRSSRATCPLPDGIADSPKQAHPETLLSVIAALHPWHGACRLIEASGEFRMVRVAEARPIAW